MDNKGNTAITEIVFFFLNFIQDQSLRFNFYLVIDLVFIIFNYIYLITYLTLIFAGPVSTLWLIKLLSGKPIEEAVFDQWLQRAFTTKRLLRYMGVIALLILIK